MALKLPNMVRVSTSTTGTGTITIGSAVSGFQTPSGAGLSDGDVFDYQITDGTAWEVGRGTLGGTGTTIARSLQASSTGSLISLSGSAVLSGVDAEHSSDGQWQKVSSQSVSAAASIDFTGLEAGYDYEVRIYNLVMATDNVNFLAQVGTGATPTYDTGSNYDWHQVYNDGAAASGQFSAGDTSMQIVGGTGRGVGNDTHEYLQGEFTIYNPGGGVWQPHFAGRFFYRDSGSVLNQALPHGAYLSTTAVTAIRFLASSGNITCDADLYQRTTGA